MARRRTSSPPFRCPWGTEIQSLLFDKRLFDPGDVQAWLVRHGFRLTLDESRNYWHARQREPKAFVPGSFRTISLGRGQSDVRAIIGCPLTPRRRRR